jgi:hypothetical protein
VNSKKLLDILRNLEDSINKQGVTNVEQHVNATNSMLITYGLLRIAEAIEKTTQQQTQGN